METSRHLWVAVAMNAVLVVVLGVLLGVDLRRCNEAEDARPCRESVRVMQAPFQTECPRGAVAEVGPHDAPEDPLLRGMHAGEVLVRCRCPVAGAVADGGAR